MPDLPRKTLKVFGGIPNDPAGESANTGIFGSREADGGGQSNLSNDIEFIQNQDSGNKWEKGWFEATIGFTRLPPAEEMEGIHRVISYSAAYLLQKGISEYDAGTTYFTGDITRRDSAEKLDLYSSRIDDNINNALPTKGFSNENWKFLDDFGNLVGTFIENVNFTATGDSDWTTPTTLQHQFTLLSSRIQIDL